MRVLRHAALDLIATALVLVATLTNVAWLWYVVMGYTALVLLSRVGALAARLPQKRPADALPDLFYHALYALTCGLLIVARQHLLVGAWLAIWALSWWMSRRR